MITVAKQQFSLGDAHRLCYRVNIDGRDFQAVKQAAAKWRAWYASKPGTDNIPFDGSLSFVEVGLLGEVAAATVLGVQARLDGVDAGDGGVDFVLDGPNGFCLPCDVKTIKSKRKERDFHIARTTHKEFSGRLASVVYVLAWLHRQARDSAVVGLWGFLTDHEVQGYPLEAKHRGRQFYRIPFSGKSRTMDDLLAWKQKL